MHAGPRDSVKAVKLPAQRGKRIRRAQFGRGAGSIRRIGAPSRRTRRPLAAFDIAADRAPPAS